MSFGRFGLVFILSLRFEKLAEKKEQKEGSKF